MHSTIRVPRPFASAPRLCRTTKSGCHRIYLAAPRGGSCGSECSTSGSDSIWWRALATIDFQKAQPVVSVALLLGMAATAGAASAADLGDVHAQPLAELAEEDIWVNLARYGRYFVTVMLGTGYVMLRPLQAMFKKPVTAILGIAAIIGLILGIRVALELMLGINEYAYNPDNFRIVSEY